MRPVELGHEQRVAFSASGQCFTQSRPVPVVASQPVVDVNPVVRHPQCGKAIALDSQVLLIGGASGIPDEIPSLQLATAVLRNS